MKVITAALLIMCFFLAGCTSLPQQNVHNGWSKADFAKLSGDDRIFDFTFASFQYHAGTSRIIKYGAKIPMSYAQHARHIDVERLVQSLKDTYDITINPAEFIGSLNQNVLSKRDGRWLNWFWRGTHKRNRLGVLLILYSAQEGFRTTPRLKVQIMLIKRNPDGKMHVVTTDANDVPLGDTSGFTAADVYKAIRENSTVVQSTPGL